MYELTVQHLLYYHYITISCVVSVSESEFSAVDQRASPGLFTNFVTQPNPLGQPLNSTRSRSADQTLQLVLHFKVTFSNIRMDAFSHTLGHMFFTWSNFLMVYGQSWLLEILYTSKNLLTNCGHQWTTGQKNFFFSILVSFSKSPCL